MRTTLSAYRLRGRELRQIALYLACVPLLIALPILSLAMFALHYHKAPSRALIAEWKLVLIAACLNLVISIYLLGQVSDAFWHIGLDGFRSLWEVILPSGPGLPADPQSVPV